MSDRYRKLPVEISARQFDGTHSGAEYILAWVDPRNLGSSLAARKKYTDEWTVVIETLEGAMAADKGDWIIQGVNGEFYPCKPDIFEKTYEKVQ